MELLLFSGSLRKESLNRKLINVVVKKIENIKNVNVKVIDLKSLDIPVYDGDIEAIGIPKGVRTLAEAISRCDGMIISSPEYNRGIAGSLKNIIDWQSRLKPVPLKGKSLLLMSASPGNFGAIRGLDQAKPAFMILGALLFGEEFSVAKADSAFDAKGDLVDKKSSEILDRMLNHYVEFVTNNSKTSDPSHLDESLIHSLNSKSHPAHQTEIQSH